MKNRSTFLMICFGIFWLFLLGSILPELIKNPTRPLITSSWGPDISIIFVLPFVIPPLLMIWFGLPHLLHRFKKIDQSLSQPEKIKLIKFLVVGYSLLIVQSMLTTWLWWDEFRIVQYVKDVLLLGAPNPNDPLGLPVIIYGPIVLFRAIPALIIGMLIIAALIAIITNRKMGFLILRVVAYTYIFYAGFLIVSAAIPSDIFTLDAVLYSAISLTPAIHILMLQKSINKIFTLQSLMLT